MAKIRRTAVQRASLVAALGMLLAGCVSDSPRFVTPIAWGDALIQREGQLFDNQYTDTTLRLNPGGLGEVTDFPVGVLGLNHDDAACLDVASDEVYSGEIRWQVSTRNQITITFRDSTVPVVSGPVKFDNQNWAEIGIVECGRPRQVWNLYATCGDAGDEVDGYARCD